MTRPTEPEANETPCERTEPLLSAYLLDEVADGDREVVASHIAGCAHCREELEMLSSAASALRSIPPLEAGLEPRERERILTAARESAVASRGTVASRGKGPRVIYLALSGLAAAAVLAALLVPGLLPFERERPIEVARAPEPAQVKAVDELRAFEKLPAGAKGPGTDPAGLAGEAGVASGTRRLDESAAESDEKLRMLALARNEAVGEKEKTDAFFFDGSETARAAPDLAFREAMPEAAKPRSADGLADGGRDSNRLAREEKEEARTTLELATRLTVAEELRRKAERPDALQDAPVQKAKRGGFRYGAPAAPSPDVRLTGPESGQPKFLDGVDITNQALEKVHEFAPGLEPTQNGLGATPTAGDLKQAQTRKATPLAAGFDPEPPKRTYRARVDAGERLADGEGPAAPAARPASAAALSTAAPGDKPAQAAPGQGVPAPATSAPVDGLQKDPAASAETDRLAAMPPGGAAAGGATTTPVPPDWKARVDEFLSRLDRRPGETPGMMFFRYWGTNPFIEASSDPLSTFAADVDTASYTIARAYFYDRGMLPPREAIRTEEFINFFKNRYASPAADGAAFAVHAEMAPSPFAHEADYQLLKVGLKGREIPKEKRKACGLVFVIDTSGSMRQGNRLELVKEALRLLVPELDEGDTVGIVAFDREARVILDPVPASEKERILDAVSRLEPRQNTNVAAGLEMGYQMAARHKVKDGSNRVLLLSDGVANTGTVDPVAMTEKVRAEREQGIYLTCVGVGMGNMNDSLMETLADRGNGQCVYVDRIEQAKKAFVDNLTGTLEAIAKDAKIQVELDPAKVIRYRLLGYENRDIADAQFRDNKVDAGEVGAGHEVTALYELKLKPDAGDTLATIRVRYLTVDHGEAVEIARPITPADRRKTLAEASPRFQVSACAAELAEVLRGSYWARGNTLDKVAAILEPILGADDPPRSNPDGPSSGKLGDDNDVIELIALAKKADALVRERDARADDIARTSDAIKENYLLRAQVEDALRARANDNRVQLDSILQQNEALRRRLEELLRR